jgi:hypothetical protein
MKGITRDKEPGTPRQFPALGIGTLSLILLILQGKALATASAWEKQRQLGDFQGLMKKSPFSLPTAEETSPLSERYAMTGIINIGGVDQVFVFDRTDQSRELLTTKPNAKNMALVSLQKEGSAPPKATIRIGGETGTIGYLEASAQPTGPVAAQPAQGSAAARQGGRLPPLPTLPQQNAANGAQVNAPQQAGAAGQPATVTPPTRRIIRRPVVTAPQTQPTTP